MENTKQAKKSIRLHSIDFARGIAILMMLQGHFISLTYAGYHPMHERIVATGTTGYFIADVWLHLRSLTAPLFFTISGLVFMFILSGDLQSSFSKHKMVKKGLRRGFMLIAIGYVIQLNFRNLSYYLSGHLNDRFFAVHVLHCIGVGLIFLVLIYGLYKLLPRLNLMWTLAFISILIFVLHPFVDQSENYIPSFAHNSIQNYIKGPQSIFPLIPWMGYLTAGGTMGVFIRRHLDQLRANSVLLKYTLTLVAILLFFRLSFYLTELIMPEVMIASYGYVFDYLTIVALLIGFLIWLEKKVPLEKTFVVVAGKNTLNIYVLHVILLYGTLIGVGIKTWYDSKLSALEAIVSAVLFILFFVLLSYAQRSLSKWYKALKIKYFGIPHTD